MSYPLVIIQPNDLIRNSRSDINDNFYTLYTLVTAGIGTSGYSGYSGYSGRSGYSGFSGSSGISGYSGFSGYSGEPAVGVSYYFTTSAAEISAATFNLMSETPEATGTNFSTPVTIADGPKLIKRFVTEPGYPSIETIPAGQWRANFYGTVTDLIGGNSYFIAQANLISGDMSTITPLFSAAFSYITTLSGSTPQFISQIATVPAPVPIQATDRLGVDMYAVTDSSTTVDVQLYLGGIFYNSNIETTIFEGAIGQSGYSGYSGFSGYSGYSGAITVAVNLSSHGFTAGDVIRNDGTADSYTKALANNPYNAEAVGIVTQIVDSNNFIYTQYGATTLGVPAVSANSVLFLSDTTPGLLTLTEPSTIGHVSKPMAIVLASGTRMEVINMRGIVIGAGSTFSQATLNNANTPYYITGNDCFLDLDASVAPLTAVLPSAVNAAGKFYHIKKVDTSLNTITILTTSSQTIDGNSNILLVSPWTSISVHSNNSNWLIF